MDLQKLKKAYFYSIFQIIADFEIIQNFPLLESVSIPGFLGLPGAFSPATRASEAYLWLEHG